MSAVAGPSSTPVASTGCARSAPGSVTADRDDNSIRFIQAWVRNGIYDY